MSDAVLLAFPVILSKAGIQEGVWWLLPRTTSDMPQKSVQ